MSGNVLNFTSRNTNDDCIFQRETQPMSIFAIYALVIPTLATFGLCTNFINAVVFMRPKMTPSAFTYLAALSWLDCISCLLITLTALSRSFYYRSPAWIIYDYQWQTPLFGISTGAANLVLACLSVDRFAYLSRFRIKNGAPSFCRRKVARYMVAMVILISAVLNMPYFFIFMVNKADGKCQVTDFYYSRFYQVHNWITFTLLALLPAIFLLVGNAAIIIAFRRWTKQSKLCQQSCPNSNASTTNKRYQHQMKLTISIVIVITLYMIGELPAHMTSRKSALNLIFGGDKDKVNMAMMDRLEVICITLNALQLSMNIVVYAVINPCFMPEFFLCMRGASDVCFRMCCLPAIERSWRRCWAHTKRPSLEQCGDGSVTPQELPAIEQSHIGFDSWSSDSECDNGVNGKSTGTSACADSGEDSKQQEVFTTKTSACLQLKEEVCLGEDSLFNTGLYIIT